MALIDDINALPATVGDGNTGHLNNHQVIHAALKDHETRLGARDMVGTGSPVGRVAATIGTTYTDTAATNGAIRWIKTSGTGTTGWQVGHGDTGWRDITPSIPSENLKSGAVFIRRSQNLVSIRFVALSSDIPARTTVLTLPPGFRPDQSSNYPISGFWGNHITTVTQISANGTIGFKDDISENAVNSVNTVTATSSWPTTLPGLPA